MVQALWVLPGSQGQGTLDEMSDWTLVMGRGKAVKARANAKQGLTESRRARSLDALAELELFDQTILPQLKKMVLENWSPDRIRKAFAPIMQAVMIKKGLEGNFKAVKDTLDRHEGTAVQRVEQKTVYASMSKKELAALALQKLLDAKIIDTTGRVIKEVKSDDTE
jgi:hypothetical protein